MGINTVEAQKFRASRLRMGTFKTALALQVPLTLQVGFVAKTSQGLGA